MGAIQESPRLKQVNGVTLHWSETYQKWAVPMPEKAKMDMVLDEETGQLMPVMRGAVVLQRFRQVTMPDGAVVMEMTLYGDELEAQKMQIEKAARQAQLEKSLFQLETWKTVRNSQWLIVVGVVASIGTFFWNICTALASTAGLIGVNVALALSEITYFAVWGVGVLLAGLVLKFVLPLLFRKSAPLNVDILTADPVAQQPTRGDGDINIFVNKNNGTMTGQDMVTNRNL